MGQPAARLGDMCTGHPAYFMPRPSISASGDVFIDCVPALRTGDKYESHCRVIIPFDCHIGVVASGSGSVFINGMPAARVGDTIDCGSKIAEGSSTTFMG